VEGPEFRKHLEERADLSPRKREVLSLAHETLLPARVETWVGAGIPLVIGRREGYRITDLDGRELLDFHLNGGTYNLGHRHPELVRTLTEALADLDIGNHHFASEERALLARALVEKTPGELRYTVFTASGTEANDVAIRSARRATGRRKVVGLESGFHGSAGLAGAAGRDRTARAFLSDYPEEFVTVPFGDLHAMEEALAAGDVAAVLMETIPATQGFPVPPPAYLPGVLSLCREHGTLFVADEVQTGLGRTGQLWGVETFGVEPDILVTGKGLSGGLYPISAVVLGTRAGAWLREEGWGFVSTFGGAELGCRVASRVLEICSDAATLEHGRQIAERMASGLEEICGRRPFLRGVRRVGLVMGLETAHPTGAIQLCRALYEHGVWAIFAGFDLSVLQWKPGLLLDEATCDEALERLDAALAGLEPDPAFEAGRA